MGVFFTILIFIFGLCIGSFLNVCVYRIPKEQSIVFPCSNCTNCGTSIRKIDLIPVISYFLLGGKCRNCSEKISIKYPLIELLTGLLFVLLYLNFGIGIKFIIYGIIVFLLIIIFFIDLEYMIIPDGLNLIIGLLGITLNILFPFASYKITLLSMLYGFLLGGGLFFILACFGAMGGGDIKLMAALGLVFGWKLLIPVMFLSFVLGGVVGIILLLLKSKGIKDMIPFGPYIVTASIVTILYGSQLTNWYLSSFVYPI